MTEHQKPRIVRDAGEDDMTGVEPVELDCYGAITYDPDLGDDDEDDVAAELDIWQVKGDLWGRHQEEEELWQWYKKYNGDRCWTNWSMTDNENFRPWNNAGIVKDE